MSVQFSDTDFFTILDFSGSGTLTARYLNGPTAAGVDAVLARETAGGTLGWYLADRLGTVRDLVNNAGSVIDHVDYNVYGAVAGEMNPSAGDRFKYAGMQADAVTGMSYDDARWYDPAAGRFASQDPTSFYSGDPDLYRYTYNQPNDYTDPTGLFGEKGGRHNRRDPWDDFGNTPDWGSVPTSVNPAWDCDRLKHEINNYENLLHGHLKDLDRHSPTDPGNWNDYWGHARRAALEQEYLDKLYDRANQICGPGKKPVRPQDPRDRPSMSAPNPNYPWVGQPTRKSPPGWMRPASPGFLFPRVEHDWPATPFPNIRDPRINPPQPKVVYPPASPIGTAAPKAA